MHLDYTPGAAATAQTGMAADPQVVAFFGMTDEQSAVNRLYQLRLQRAAGGRVRGNSQCASRPCPCGGRGNGRRNGNFMANELVINHPTGATLYACCCSMPTGQIWNGSAFAAPSSAAWTDYDIAMSEVATATASYRASMPAAAAGVYGWVVRSRAVAVLR